MGKDRTPQERATKRFAGKGLPRGAASLADEVVLAVRNESPAEVASLPLGFHLRLARDRQPTAVRNGSQLLGHLYPDGDEWIRGRDCETCVLESHGVNPDDDFFIRVTGYRN